MSNASDKPDLIARVKLLRQWAGKDFHRAGRYKLVKTAMALTRLWDKADHLRQDAKELFPDRRTVEEFVRTLRKAMECMFPEVILATLGGFHER